MPTPSIEDHISMIESDTATAATRLGRHELADRLWSGRAAERSRDVTLVVAGETSRGKSSLIGALLGRPSLLPADADVTTNVYVLIRYGTPEQATVLLDSGDRLTVSREAIADWVSVGGNPLNAKGVKSVELLIDHPLLAGGLTIVDTPGVGGIEAGHADMTMVALSAADAMLFVKDARGPIGAPEAGFLRRAADRIETVIFCLTKTDLFELGWEAVARDDRQFLNTHLPRFSGAPIVPVSARRAELAGRLAAAGDTGTAADLRRRSGLDELTALIADTVVGPGLALRRANRLRAVISALDTLEREQDARAASARGDKQHLQDLLAARLRAQEYQRATSAWSIQLGDDLTRLRLEVLRRLNLELEAIRTRFAATAMARPEQGLAFASELPEQLVGLTARLNAIMNDGVVAIADRLRQSLSVEGIAVSPVDVSVGLQTGRQPLDIPGSSGIEETLRWGSALLGVTTPMLIMSSPVYGFLGPPLAIIAIATTGLRWWQDRRGRDLNAARQAWSAQLTDTLSEVKITLPPEIELRLLEVRTAMAAAVRLAVDGRIAELKQHEDELRKLAEATERERAAAIKNAEDVKRDLADLRARAGRLMTGARLATAGSPVSAVTARVDPAALPAEAPPTLPSSADRQP